MAAKRQNADYQTGPGEKKPNVPAPFKFIAFQKSKDSTQCEDQGPSSSRHSGSSGHERQSGGYNSQGGGFGGSSGGSNSNYGSGGTSSQSRHRPQDINLKELVNPRELDEKRRYLRQLLVALDKKTNSPDKVSDTSTLSHATQICRTNPKYSYVDLSRVNIDTIPSDLFRGRGNRPSEGYISELRIQGIYFSLGYGVCKTGARDRASENALRILRNRDVCILPMQRTWRQTNYPEFVLCPSPTVKMELAPFFEPPEGTAENQQMRAMERRKIDERRSEGEKKTSAKLGFQNTAHMGPQYSGKKIENFVILLNEDNPVCIMNTSAQFCKMSVDYYFEKPLRLTGNDFMVTIFIEGVAVADAKGPKKMLKYKVSESALKCLNKFCYTVITNKSIVNSCSTLNRFQIKGSSTNEGRRHAPIKTQDEDGADTVAVKMMKLMGWSEGAAIGGRFKGRLEPVQVTNESINREGLGSQAIDSDKINREEAEEIVKKYAASDRVDDLVFSSELNFEERRELRVMAKRYGLSEKIVLQPNGKGKSVFLVLSKKIQSDIIIEQLEREGQFGKYELINPGGGDRSVISKFLNYQHMRKSTGFPQELREMAAEAGHSSYSSQSRRGGRYEGGGGGPSSVGNGNFTPLGSRGDRRDGGSDSGFGRDSDYGFSRCSDTSFGRGSFHGRNDRGHNEGGSSAHGNNRSERSDLSRGFGNRSGRGGSGYGGGASSYHSDSGSRSGFGFGDRARDGERSGHYGAGEYSAVGNNYCGGGGYDGYGRSDSHYGHGRNSRDEPRQFGRGRY